MSQSSSESQNSKDVQLGSPQNEVSLDEELAAAEAKVVELRRLKALRTQNSKISTEGTLEFGLLNNCAKNGDEVNAKLAQTTLKNIKKNGLEGALAQMAKDCFKHPETGRPLSYGEMRMYYG